MSAWELFEQEAWAVMLEWVNLDLSPQNVFEVIGYQNSDYIWTIVISN